MDIEEKEKNILDLRYQTQLNYFNILVISIITTFVTIAFTSPIKLPAEMLSKRHF